jgi:undecaprenyl-diphosphatase
VATPTRPAPAVTAPASAPATAPNPSERHASDLIRLVAGALVLSLTALAVREGQVGLTESSLFRLINQLPSFLEDPLRVLELAALAAGVAVPLYALLTRRLSLARDLAAAAVLAWGLAEIIERVVERGHPEGLLNGVEIRGIDVSGFGFPAVTVAVAAGLAAVASPYLTRVPRAVAWSLVALVAIARVFVGAHLPGDAVAGWAVGWIAGALVHLAFGSPVGRPTLAAVSDALARAGLTVGDLAPVGLGRRGSTMFSGHADDGTEVFCRAIGRDERDVETIDKLWRSLALRDQRDQPFFTSQQAVEHEAYLGLLAARAGVRTPAVRITAGFDGGAVLAQDRAPGDRLSARAGDGDVDDAVLDDVWRNLAAVRGAHLAHGALRAENVFVDGTTTWLVDWGDGRAAAEDHRQAEDVAELLMSLAVRVGASRAVAGAARVLGADALVPVLPLLQPAVLSSPTRKQVKAHKGLIDEVRAEAAKAAGVEEPKLQPLTRIRPEVLASCLILGLAVYFLVPQLGEAGQAWQAIIHANVAWVATAVAFGLLTFPVGAISQNGAVARRLPLTRTTVLQMAAAFASRITPASLGTLAVRVRYLQRCGLDSEGAVTGTALNSVAGGLARILAIAIAIPLVGTSGFGDRGINLPNGWLILAAVVALGVVAGVIVFTAFGHRLLRPVIRAFVELREVLKQPAKATALLGGALGVIVLNTLCFGAALAAVNANVSPSTVIVVYVLGSTVGGAAPSPGGLGVVEAALVAGLTAAGVDPSDAVAGTLVFRLITYWLPIPLGWFSLQRLRREGLL